MLPILELIHIVCVVAHGNMPAVVGRSPPSWRELGTASLFTASSPITLGLCLGEHRLIVGAGNGRSGRRNRPVPAPLPRYACGGAEGVVVAKTDYSEGLSMK